ncbi:hypothetical protein MUG78_03555 [Gordonia alkaliphila]|uniref:DUF4190 domain-containing protein n=1 Tax=Gordonia alkaliphila TaxID=1053547 RepID=A0ABP8Z257_9ACTN|nr:hypothetical protein [Gordonia alkaliphila]MCK0438562.1 hypothetical protein [Gordonia alkaliphila]
MDFVTSILRVLAVGLLLGAGLPALFGVGMRLVGMGSADPAPDGTLTGGNAALRYLGYLIYAVVGAIILVSILWIARQTLLYYFDIKIFPAFAYK